MEELGGEFDREASGNSQYKITSEGDVNNDFGQIEELPDSIVKAGTKHVSKNKDTNNNKNRAGYNPELGMMSAIKEEEESKLYQESSLYDDMNVSRIEGGGGIVMSGGHSDYDLNSRDSYGLIDSKLVKKGKGNTAGSANHSMNFYSSTSPKAANESMRKSNKLIEMQRPSNIVFI